MSNEDWKFDLGTDNKGFFMVEAWASTIPNRTYSRLTREQLLQLRGEINSALHRYPKPLNPGGGDFSPFNGLMEPDIDTPFDGWP